MITKIFSSLQERIFVPLRSIISWLGVCGPGSSSQLDNFTPRGHEQRSETLSVVTSVGDLLRASSASTPAMLLNLLQ